MFYGVTQRRKKLPKSKLSNLINEESNIVINDKKKYISFTLFKILNEH